ncbi:hypothetical protein [Streptomyces sp. NPDC014685]|uniref:hypothetical protein n=1 Tax=Streptomyces sp. NPDC014685 TaxID=3364881 RepID=UPI0036FBDEBC
MGVEELYSAFGTVAKATAAAFVVAGVLTVGSHHATEVPREAMSVLTATSEREAVAQPTAARTAAVIPVRTGQDQWMWMIPVGAGSASAAPEDVVDSLIEV